MITYISSRVQILETASCVKTG